MSTTKLEFLDLYEDCIFCVLEFLKESEFLSLLLVSKNNPFSDYAKRDIFQRHVYEGVLKRIPVYFPTSGGGKIEKNFYMEWRKGYSEWKSDCLKLFGDKDITTAFNGGMRMGRKQFEKYTKKLNEEELEKYTRKDKIVNMCSKSSVGVHGLNHAISSSYSKWIIGRDSPTTLRSDSTIGHYHNTFPNPNYNFDGRKKLCNPKGTCTVLLYKKYHDLRWEFTNHLRSRRFPNPINVLCFSVDNVSSFDDLVFPDFRSSLEKMDPDSKTVLLLGLRSDLPHHVSPKRIIEYMDNNQGLVYIELSAKDGAKKYNGEFQAAMMNIFAHLYLENFPEEEEELEKDFSRDSKVDEITNESWYCSIL